jgi:hypothetical protein
MQKFSVRAAVAAVLAASVVTGCGAAKSAAPPGRALPAVSPAASVDASPAAPSEQPSPVPVSPLLRDVWSDVVPEGSATQIALRFLVALQHGDEQAAVRELSLVGRSYFAVHDGEVRHLILRDVAAHAALAHAGPCTSADRLTAEAVVVRCGRANIVVHVLDDPLAPGVQLAPWHVRHDVFHGPHTHAFTTVML